MDTVRISNELNPKLNKNYSKSNSNNKIFIQFTTKKNSFLG